MVMVHLSVAVLPAVMPVTVVVLDVGVVIVAVPETTDHAPVPVVGLLPAIVNEAVLHWLMSTPAFAVVGVAELVRMTSLVEAVQVPLLMVHLRVAVLPAVIPVTVVVAEDVVVIVAVPETTDHAPVPVVGALPAMVNVEVLH